MVTATEIDPSHLTSERVEITSEYIDFFRKNGYLVVQDALSSNEVEQLCDEPLPICHGERGHREKGFRHLNPPIATTRLWDVPSVFTFPTRFLPLCTNILLSNRLLTC